MSIDPLLLGAGIATLFFAGLVQGLTGFGFALVAVPVLSLLLSPKAVVPMVILYAMLSNVMILQHARHHVQPQRFWPLALAGIAGVPVGAWLLVVMSPDSLRLLIGATVVAAALILAMGVRFHVRRERLAFGPVGFVSGVLSGSIAVGGPPVILFFTNQGIPREVFRANITAYFMTITVATITAFLTSGVLTREVALYALWFLPGPFIGVMVGNRLTRRLPERVFRGIALTLVMGAGGLSVANGLGFL